MSNEVVSGLVVGVFYEINIFLGVNIGNCMLFIELFDEIFKKYNFGVFDVEFFCEFLDIVRDLLVSMFKNMCKVLKLLFMFK